MAIITGTSDDDVLLGTNVADTINSLAGNDVLSGLGGNDNLNGGEGHDRLDGGAGTDIMVGGQGDDTYVVDSAADSVGEAANEGHDTIESSVTRSLGANVEDLVLTGLAAINGTGNDADNIIKGNSNNNVLDGRLGVDSLEGGEGSDTYIIDDASEINQVVADGGTDLVRSSVTYGLGAEQENLILTGLAAIDATGNSGNNILTGNAASNTLDGGAGNDTLVGGAGDDTYIIDSASDAITEGASAGADTVRTALSYVLGANVEHLLLTGNSNVDGTGNTGSNSLTGNAGNNALDGKTGADTMTGGDGDDSYVVDNIGDVVVEGDGLTSGSDTVTSAIAYTLGTSLENLTLGGQGSINGTGNALDNIIKGNSSVNVLTGGAGVDTLEGAAGNDTLDGGTGIDILAGGDGNDTYLIDDVSEIAAATADAGTDLVKSTVDYTLGANQENLTLLDVALDGTGNSGNNTLTGNAGNNTLDGGAGDDRLAGGAGDDTYVVDSATDLVIEIANAGDDTVRTVLAYTLGRTLENLELTGSANVNGAGNAADNKLTGNAGNNLLDGKAGTDQMTGGDGDDNYVVDNLGDTVAEGSGLNAGNDKVTSAVSFVLGANIEALSLSGSGAINGTGNDANNVITGNSNSNVLDGGLGLDTLEGGAGHDTYVIDDASEINQATVDAGQDLVKSSVTYTLGAQQEHLTLTGLAAIDGTGNALANILLGNDAINTLTGGLGNDTLDGGLRLDHLVGGDGNDTYLIDDASEISVATTDAGTDLVKSTVDYTLGANQENLSLLGVANLNGAGNSGNNVITGNAGANILNGGAETGADVLDGGLGADTLVGGAGNDTYVVDNAGDTVTEALAAGTDKVNASLTYSLGVNVENLTLTGSGDIDGTGNASNNIITGNTGNNVLYGGAGGVDTLAGGLGNDTYIIDSTGDAITEALNTGTADTVESTISYILGANLENLTLTGSGSTTGIGNTLANVIVGNSGDNVIDGGVGTDTLHTGDGSDTIVYDATDSVVDGGTGSDLLEVTGLAQVLDLVTPANLAGFEKIDLNNGGNRLQLSAAAIVALSETDTVTVDGGAADAVMALGTWTHVGDVAGYARYTQGLATLDVALAINRTGISTNLAPVNAVPGSQTTNEDTALVFSTANGNALAVSDGNNDTLSVTLTATHGALTLAQTTNLTSVTGNGTGVISFTGLAGDINAALDGLHYQSALDYNGAAQVTLSISDAQFNDIDSIAISIVPMDDAPTTSPVILTSVAEDSGARLITQAELLTNASDVDSPSLSAIGLAITSGLGSLVNNNGGTWSFTPSLNDDTSVSFAYTVTDGTSVTAGAASLDMTALNDAPVLSNFGDLLHFGDAPYTYADAPAAPVDTSISLRDADHTLIAGATMSIGGAQVGDRLLFTDQSGISGSFSTATGTLMLSGAATLAEYETALESVTFSTSSVQGGERSISVVVTDGLNASISQSVRVGTPARFELTHLNGSNGFVLDGADAGDYSGHSVGAAGDVNGDGFGDLIIGAIGGDAAGNAKNGAGESYVVFGKASGFTTRLDLSTLNGSNGFVLDGVDAGDRSGRSVSSAGDVNGDGFGDLIIGAPYGAVSGESYVVFGKASGFTARLDLSTLNGSNGFVLDGVDTGDLSGRAVSAAGDVNGDGIGDLIIGAPFADAAGNAIANAGESYVVFGKASGFATRFELSTLDGSNGFVLDGVDVFDFSGRAVSAAGDVNGDGVGDLIIGATGGAAAGDAKTNAGESYVVFGHASGFTARLALSTLNGSNGFVVDGLNAGNQSGRSVSSAGDVNGDGYGDLLIGAPADRSYGVTYVVFGKADGFNARLDLASLNGSNGFVLRGGDVADSKGHSVSAAGDLNGDGFGDLLIGAYRGDADANLQSDAGESYVVFGKATGFAAELLVPNVRLDSALLTLNQRNVLVLDGVDSTDLSAYSVSAAGDVNGDGFGDLIIGARNGDAAGNGKSNAGESYVLFGRNFNQLATSDDALNGTAGNDFLVGGLGNDTLNGSAGSDVLKGAAGDDNLVYDPADRVVDGGSGFDTLTLTGAGATLNLPNLIDSKISGIERIDLTGTGNNSLTLNALDVLNLSDTSNTVRVEGDSGDVINLDVGWIAHGQKTIGVNNYIEMVQGAATILVDEDINRITINAAPVNSVPGSQTTTENSALVFSAANGNAIVVSDPNGDRQTITLTASNGVLTLASVAGLNFITGDGVNDATISVSASLANLNAALDGLSFAPAGYFVGAASLNVFTADGALSDSDNVSIIVRAGPNAPVVTGFVGSVSTILDVPPVVLDAAFSISDADDTHLTGATLVVTGTHAEDSLNFTDQAGISGIYDENSATLTLTGSATLAQYEAALESVTFSPTSFVAGVRTVALTLTDGIHSSESHAVTIDVSARVDLANLNGSNGFVLDGVDAGDLSGFSVSKAGDVNGDGFGDLIIGAPLADAAGNAIANAGESYVVFGKASGFTTRFELSSLDGSNGFVLDGVDAFDFSGRAVRAAGDVNGDGFGDFIIGAYRGDAAGNAKTDAGESYVVFGQATGFAARVDLSTLNGSNGFVVDGRVAGFRSGESVSAAGDVNGDGFGDLIIGAPFGSNGAIPISGESYVVLGRATGFTARFDSSTLNGNNGFRLDGAGGLNGTSVSAAGDVNGDGFADLIIGAPSEGLTAGRSYLVLGKAGGFNPSLSLATAIGAPGGADAADLGGFSVSTAGDVNGDGFADLIIGAPGAAAAGNAKYQAGESYVVFGRASGFTPGFVLDGVDAFDASGRSVSAAGDVNGDGFGDLIIGAPGGDAAGNVKTDAGESYVVFGKATGFAAHLDLSALNGSSGFVLDGVDAGDRSESSFGAGDTFVSAAGDVNGDGFADLIIGAQLADAAGNATPNGGETYVLFGRNFNHSATSDDTLTGTAGNDFLIGGLGNDTLDGGAGSDVLKGAAGDDTLVYDAADRVVEGGSGFDTLTVTGAGAILDLTNLLDSRLTGIERVDLTGTGNNILSLNAREVLHLSDTSNTLRVEGNSGDTVAFGSGWIVQGLKTIGANTYREMVQGAATLLVDTDVSEGSILRFDLSTLNGSNGFVLDGVDFGDRSGAVSAAGDVNGDGFGDLIIGARYADAAGNALSNAGQSYVVFGQANGFAARLDLSTLTGSNGFVLDGLDTGDLSGRSVSAAGDVNGDGFSDLIIGASSADAAGNTRPNAGESYVVFGKASGFASHFDLASLNGSNGFVLDGESQQDSSGSAVSGAGDVNGDGIGDLIIGAVRGSSNLSDVGHSYVVFGRANGFMPRLDLSTLSGSNGFALDGVDNLDQSGFSVSAAGDVNGDGFGDLIIGARLGDAAANGKHYAGESYVVFGKASGFTARFDLSSLNGSNGFVLDGVDPFDFSGRAVRTAGDVNGDGFADLIIGADSGDAAGESYVFFGQANGFTARVDLSTLNGSNGFVLDGADANDASGVSVSAAGDVNGDGFGDLIIGASHGDAASNAKSDAGESYLVFGKAGGFASRLDLARLNGHDGIVLDGVDAGDHSGGSVSAAGDVNGDGYSDLIIGAEGGDAAGNAKNFAGESYVVFGRNFNEAATSDDILHGTASNDFLIGGLGNDTLEGGAGSDVLKGAAGDDTLVYDATDRLIEGGSGFDTLVLVGAGVTLDLTTLLDSKLTGIERIDLTGTGNSTLTLNALDVLNLSDTSNTLRVEGNAGDAINLGTGWFSHGIQAIGANNYYEMVQGAATVLIDTDISGVVIDTAPVNGVPGSQTTNEDTALVFSTGNGNALSVSDGENDLLAVTLTATHGALTLAQIANLTDLSGNGTGVITFTGIATDINAALNGLNYQSALGYNGGAQVTLRSSDAQFSDIDAVAINIMPVNDAPTTIPVSLTAIAEDIGVRTITQAELLVNAHDIDSPILTASGLTITSGLGSLADNNDGTWNYTPASNDDVSVSFSYTVGDGSLTATGAATLDITPVNDAPTTTPLILTSIVEDDGSRLITQAELLAHASDVDSQSLTASGLAIARGIGSLVDNNDDTWSYTPATNDDTSVSFSYIVNDASLSAIGSAILDITPLNDAPTTTPVMLTAIAEDSGTRLITQAELLAHATDVDSPSLSATGLAIASGLGSLINNNDGTWSYTPASNDDTSASFSYTVTDGSLTTTGAATLDITPLNDAPTTTPVPLTAIAEDSGVRTITQAELLVNAHDIDGPSVTAGGLAIANGLGSLANNNDGTWSYTPASNDDTSVSFEYTVTDGSLTATGSATLDITPANDAPTTAPVTLTAIVEDSGTRLITQAELLAHASDLDSLSLSATGLTIANGLGSLSDNNDGTWNYTPASNDDTSLSFSYAVNDGSLTATGSATLDITPVNDAPTATSVTLTAIAEDGGSRLITQAELLDHASDVDNQSLTATGLTIASGLGNLVDNNDGTWSYLPASNDDTSVSFGYTVSDESLATTGTAALDITPVNDAPTTTPVTLTAIAEDSGARLITQAELLAHASDVDSPSLTAAGLTIATGLGSLVENNDGTWSYTQASNDHTAVSFSYTVSDGSLTTTGSATLDITPVNDAPTVTDFGGTIFTRTDAPSVLLDSTITLSDVDSGSLVAATLTIGQYQIYDRLNFTDQNGIAGSFEANTGQLTLSGTATLAEYKTVIESVTFETASIFGGDRSITLQATDGLLWSVPEGMLISSDQHLEPANLNGSNGFVLYGVDASDQSGFSVSEAGDVNGDGFGDLLIGAIYADGSGNGKLGAGETYVVFGKAGGFAAQFELSSLDGSNGFVLDGVDAQDYSGASVSSAGDVNGDGFGDLLIGTSSTVESYVVFGRTDFMPLLDPMLRLNLASLDGGNGFTLDGVVGSDRTGYSVSAAGDVNSDGLGDLIIGAPSSDAAGNLLPFAGESYVVFGQTGGFGPRFDLSSLDDNIRNSDGSKGFVMYGLHAYDRSGFSVSAAGDVNGDGISDLVIGAPLSGSAGNATPQAGESYVVFGKASALGLPSPFGQRFDLSSLDGINGFVMYGADADDQSGHSVSAAGDVNGDGLGDLLIGAHRGAGSGNGNSLAGETYVVFGTNDVITSPINLANLDGSNGFVVDGIDSGDYSGSSVSAAGDINGDGFGDLLIGAPSGDPGFARGNPVGVGGSQLYAGETYVLFGKASGFTARLDLFSFDGFVLDGADAGDFSGRSVSAGGDVNGDGFADLLIGAPLGDGAGNANLDAGESYVFFGRNFNQVATTDDTLTGNEDNNFLVGGLGDDTLDGAAGIDVLIGGAGNDVLIYDSLDRRVDGGSGTDILKLATDTPTLDLHALGQTGRVFTDLEALDLSGAGFNVVNLTVLDVLNLSTTSHSLKIFGDAGDEVISLGQNWVEGAGGPITFGDGRLYNSYTHDAAHLFVDTALTQTQIT